MPKIRLTKNELKKQKESLKRFFHYLPMLQLKKKQLQLEIMKIHQVIKELAVEIENLRKEIILWIDVFAEEVSISEFFSIKNIKTEEGNVAGIELPVFVGVEFEEKSYDLMLTPFWVDKAIVILKEKLTLKIKLAIYHKQMHILKDELRVIAQRVNLFEKIKIPEAKENIRVIQIFIGELQTAEVVRGKIAKAKLEKKKSMVVL